jgi:TPR repeat protein
MAVLAVTGGAHAAERRVAFVVGNSTYETVPQLPNPGNDAQAVAAALKRSGFEVVTALNLDKVRFDEAFERYIRSLAGAELSVFYYSGHGIQVGGENRIIPVDAKLQSAADLEVETVSVRTIMSYMQANSKIQLVFLDSCRNNPFPSTSFLVGPERQVAVSGVGLAPLEGSLGNLIAFSTQPGEVAVDGTGDKSPFTESVLRHSFKLGVDVQTSLAEVTQEVWEATNNRQKPWIRNTLVQPVFLRKPAIRIAAAQPAEQVETPSVKIGSAPAQDSSTSSQQMPSQFASLLEEVLSKPQRVPIGVGQVAMLGDLPIIRAASNAQVEFSSMPQSGVMYLDGKVLVQGDVVDQDSLRNVTFEPSIGSEKKIQNVELKVSQSAVAADATVVNGQIEPFVVACDDEAGEPLDLQGVGAGKLPNEIDPETAIPACADAVQKFPGVARYKYQLGRAKLAGKDVAGAIELFNQAAEAGHTRAFNQLGYMAQLGLGRPQDLAEANRLFKVASDLGDPYGMLSYGRNLARGRGVERNVEAGIALLNRSVELGHTYAMNTLGAMYYYGENLKENPKRGLRFYEASLARGDIYAMRNIGIAYLEGKGVKKDTTTALALFKKASEGGHPSAPTDIGAMYFNGNGVKKDLDEAIRWYQLGAERGDLWAASNLAWIYAKGPSSKRDLQKAVQYSSLSIALDSYDSNAKEKAVLKAMPAAAKKKVIKQLVTEVGNANLETASDIDSTLVVLSRKAWQIRNPRLDLF